MLRRAGQGALRRSMCPLRKRWEKGRVMPNAKIGRIGGRISLWFVFRSWYPLFLFVELRFKSPQIHMKVRKNRISRGKMVSFTLQVFLRLKSAFILHFQFKWWNSCILQGFVIILTHSFAWLLIREAEKITAEHRPVSAKCKHYARCNSKTVNLSDLKMSQACAALLITQ